MVENPKTPLLTAGHLVAVLPGDSGDVAVLDDVSFSLAEGEIVDVVGPSGSGKTTFLRALARLLPSVTGELAFDGVSAADMSPQRWRDIVALLPQKPAIVYGTVSRNLLLPWELKVRAPETTPPAEDLRSRLDAVGLSGIALERDAARLSVGQQARLALVRVLLTHPRVLLLDEADAALDDESSAAVTRAVARFAEQPEAPGVGRGVVRVRHRSDDGLARRRMRLAGGHLQEVAR